MFATLVLTVVVMAAVMALLAVTPVLFRPRNVTAGGPFDIYFEGQCIAYIETCWLALIKYQEDYLTERHQVDYLVALIFLCSVILVLAVERDPNVEFNTWFNRWLRVGPSAQVQLYLLLVAWHIATKKQPQLREQTLVELLQRWQ